MEIETKFKLGQEVWVVINNKVENRMIWRITMRTCNTTFKESFDIFYSFKNDYTSPFDQFFTPEIKECELFATKEELIKSL